MRRIYPNQQGMLSVFVCMIILILMFIGAFTLILRLGIMKQQTQSDYRAQQALDIASSGAKYARNVLNKNISKLSANMNDGQLIYNIDPITINDDFNLSMTVKNKVKNQFDLLEIDSVAISNDQSLRRSVFVELYFDDGQYVMIPGSWRDFKND